MRKCRILRVSLTLLCALYASLSFAQVRKITGKITDDRQVPLSGATITVKGTKVATSTDAAGNFSINVPQNGKTLVVSFVGMQAQEVSIGSSDAVSVSLSA